MKTIFRIALAAAVVATMAGCKAFRTLTDSRLKTAQGAPYELIVVCPQQEWTGEVGDTLRAIFTAPIPYLNQTEPLFDVLRVTERGFTGMVADHRNILKVLKDPTLTESSVAVQYDVTSEPQIVMTLMGPSDKSITAFLSANRGNIVLALENAERDRAIKYAEKFNEKGIHDAILKNFGVEMNVPKAMRLPRTNPISCGRATNTPRPARASSSTLTPTRARSRFRPGRCSPPATSSPPAFPARRTVHT